MHCKEVRKKIDESLIKKYFEQRELGGGGGKGRREGEKGREEWIDGIISTLLNISTNSIAQNVSGMH